MNDAGLHYPDQFVTALQAVWGDGFLSPGGPTEVAVMLDGIDLSGLSVLDIGCGVGGIDVLLADDYGAAHVTAVDVEPQLIEHARQRVQRLDLTSRIELVLVEPGLLPFDEARFDAVFSKDAMLHIPDKLDLYRDVLRVLKPGGFLIGSDWLRGGADDGPVPDILRQWQQTTGLTHVTFATAALTERALRDAGFESVRVVDRHGWYAQEILKEEAQVTGPGFQQLAAALGTDAATQRADSYRIRRRAVDAGALRPTHLFARKAD